MRSENVDECQPKKHYSPFRVPPSSRCSQRPAGLSNESNKYSMDPARWRDNCEPPIAVANDVAGFDSMAVGTDSQLTSAITAKNEEVIVVICSLHAMPSCIGIKPQRSRV